MKRIGLSLALTVLAAGCSPVPASVSPSPPVSAPPSASAPAAATLAVYYLGTERHWREAEGQPVDRVKLYREFHRLPAGDDSPPARTAAAVTAMLDRSSAFDPDYRTGWPPGVRVLHVAVEGDTVTVDLGGAGSND